MSYSATIKAPAYGTDAGPVILASIVNLPECTLDKDNPQTRVVFMVALLASDNPTWCLFYHRGGDWASFGEDDCMNIECIDEWMPDAIRNCTEAVRTRLGDVADEDMVWFDEWAEHAKETLES